MFDGRIAEDFKLSTGTFVSVGPLRAKVITQGFPFVQDAVVTGINRNEIGLLLIPRLDAWRRELGAAADAPAATLLAHERVRDWTQALADRFWVEGSGSANRPALWLWLAEPPSIDHGEITDKGSINQRAVLTHRAELVEQLHGDAADAPGTVRPKASAAAAPADGAR
jgi:feruloyl-CoA synthase